MGRSLGPEANWSGLRIAKLLFTVSIEVGAENALVGPGARSMV